ncbi:hypothetical protein ONS95_002729 [Cadophora gregata]|uniref:uncharacterized protein n=1 Tax=Cadophora gregata TaxID=51156 RepID=UPI0026DBC862|nr:uncharacterized protein ONS95_002729 [Cadophora gregata]KAK0110072.1 hypothetical protein ONS95_002729 [Cadophora gregata]KAK0110309.1 hypothetical protein ONS96_001927 [Cadophora gregata f. sp. sojae]
MGPLMTPTTELFYAFINLDDTPVPYDLPEEDVFSRAFKQATIAQPQFRKNDLNTFTEQDSPQDSPQDLVFDDFPSLKASNQSGDTSPSSAGSSSVKPFSNTTKYTTTSSYQQSARNSSTNSLPVAFPDASSTTISQNTSQAPVPNISTSQLEAVETPQSYTQPIPNTTPIVPPSHPHEPSKPPPRRRNTKRKQRTVEEEAEKRRIFLERNRMAAQKCRSRKKRQTNTLEDDLAVQEEINARLKGEVADLTAELRKLKEVYLQCEQECRHAKMQESAPEEVPSSVMKEEVLEDMDVS